MTAPRMIGAPHPAAARSRRMAGKVAVVTGAGNGIGAGIARAFAASGAVVIGCDLDEQAAARVATQAKAEGLELTMVAPCDLLAPDGAQRLMDDVGGRHGRIDVLVNAAARAVFRSVDTMTLQEWRQTLSGELDIVFLAVRAAWPHLRASGAAAIVNFASANAYHALDGSPAVAHCAGKGGVLAMTRQLAAEGAPHGIRANTISPGFIQTAATRAHLASDPALERQVLAKNMVKRLGTPEDIAYCATWLASDEAGYVTGADIRVDAGATAW